eukprot:CAMPEP_0184545396 /NCGR_PEP_ID=MMETSP0199_2-20130426/4273_1 /TAXON_ID=1112570 /ORGANISM="Thraustochytrium sp., Strain LLF1b" /LENGTH=798 /DNA_ID=CAMNT_0026939693 /DNA_START=177 /DNA_END=2573 /DNA_ORIENTATION=+
MAPIKGINLPLNHLPWQESKTLPKNRALYVGEEEDLAITTLETIEAGSYSIVNGQIVMTDGERISVDVNEAENHTVDKDDVGAGAEAGETEAGPTSKKKRKNRRKKKKSFEEAVTAEGEDTDENGGVLSQVPEQEKTTDEGPSAASKSTKKTKKKKKPAEKATAAEVAKAQKDVDDIAITIPDGFGTWSGYGLNNALVHGIASLGYEEPTPIQSICLPKAILAGRDILGAAQTGSGKTLAFGLPILDNIMRNPPAKGDGLAALVMVPTRELALQVSQHLKDVLGVYGRRYVRIATIVGGVGLAKQNRVLSKEPQVVVATPGRFWALVEDDNEHLVKLHSTLRFLVIDEADRMFDKGHFPELKPLLKLLSKSVENPLERKVKRQTFLFSATLLLTDAKASKKGGKGKKGASDKKETGKHVNKKGQKKGRKEDPADDTANLESPFLTLLARIGCRGKPAICFIKKEASEEDKAREEDKAAAQQATGKKKNQAKDVVEVVLPENLTLCKAHCSEHGKDEYLYYFLNQYPGRTLVFVNTIASLKKVADILKFLGVENVDTLHANMQQRQRYKQLDRFTKGETGVLVATDVAARGLDISKIDHVIQYNLPATVDSFVHRAGRTARANNKGLCLALVGSSDVKAYARLVEAIGDEKFTDFPISMTYLPKVKARVGLARRIELLARRKKAKAQDREWYLKNAAEADLDIDEDILHSIGGGRKKKNEEKKADQAEKELASLMANLAELVAEPLLPNYLSKKYISTSDGANSSIHSRLVSGKKRSAAEDLASVANLSGKKRREAIVQ